MDLSGNWEPLCNRDGNSNFRGCCETERKQMVFAVECRPALDFTAPILLRTPFCIRLP